LEIKVAPSLLSADFSDLTQAVRKVEAGGARYLHFDVMDGHFVPNITFGSMVVQALRPITDLDFVVHLMIYHPEQFIEDFAKAGANSITVHAEACTHLHRVIQQIKASGARAGVALNPATSLSAVEYVIGDIDLLLVMTVNPGFGGQEFIESMVPKIAEARRMANSTGREIDIAVDGGIDFETCRLVVDAGANLLVAGSSIFNNKIGISEAVRKLETCCRG
jgi:ribulose-phosphate 3-epimerase